MAPFKRHQWGELSESFRHDAQAYLAMRADLDLFDERPNAPKQPLAASTLRQQNEHLRLAASILIESGVAVEDIKCLADLVRPERFKIILRYYHDRANRKPNARLRYLPVQDPYPGCAISCRRHPGRGGATQALCLQTPGDPLWPHGQEQGCRGAI
jgi:hypothetical protein